MLESKSAALVAAVFVDFPNNECNFLHKNKLDIVLRYPVCIIDCQCRRVVQFLTGRRRPMKSFSAAAVDTIVLWKSAPAHMTSHHQHLNFPHHSRQSPVTPAAQRLKHRYDVSPSVSPSHSSLTSMQHAASVRFSPPSEHRYTCSISVNCAQLIFRYTASYVSYL